MPRMIKWSRPCWRRRPRRRPRRPAERRPIHPAEVLMRALIPMLAVCLLSIPAAAQTTTATKTVPDLAKENAELRAYADKLEARVAELEAKLKAQAKPAPRVL